MAEKSVQTVDKNMLALLAKLHRIMEASPYLQKDKKHYDGYKYLSEAKIKEHFQHQFAKEKILFLPVSSAITNTLPTTSAKGSPQFLTEITFDYQIVDVETGAFIIGRSTGQGEDRSDKGVYKAITGALKYALTTTFLLPTGDDPENEEEDKHTPAPTKQAPPVKQAPPAKRSAPQRPPILNRSAFTGRQLVLANAVDLLETADEIRRYWKELPKADQDLIKTYCHYKVDKIESERNG